MKKENSFTKTKVVQVVLVMLMLLLAHEHCRAQGTKEDTTILTVDHKSVRALLESKFVPENNIYGYLVITDDRKLIAKGITLYMLDGSRVDVYFEKEIKYRISYSNPCLLHKKIGRQRIGKMYKLSRISTAK